MPPRINLKIERDEATGLFIRLCRCYTRSHHWGREWITFRSPHAINHACMNCFRRTMRSKPDLPQNVDTSNLSLESASEVNTLLGR